MTIDPCKPSAYSVVLDTGRPEECCNCDGGRDKSQSDCFACKGTGVDETAHSTYHMGPFASLSEAQRAIESAAEFYNVSPDNAVVTSTATIPQGDLLLEDARKMTKEQVIAYAKDKGDS